jgi:hypothetical protein
MSQSHLAACPSCARHVRVSEPACPFCRPMDPDSFRALRIRKLPGAGLSRGALFALSAGAVAAGCAGATNASNSDKGGSSDAADSDVGDESIPGAQPPLGGQCNACEEAGFATFDLSCSPNDLTSVVASGPCAIPDASLEQYTGPATEWFVAVGSPSPGECHIVLTFATGFTYSADVAFTSRIVGCAGCPPSIGPTGGPFTVNNPSDTCVAVPHAGADVVASDAADAGAE